jgi:predicted anti-sigma-YlaC factor YlaD
VECCSTGKTMDCRKFQEKLGDYFDSSLQPLEAKLFRAHALQCRACRSVMDELKTVINVCKRQDDLEPPVSLEEALAAIPDEHAAFGCRAFEALITEFLDGFVPAPIYHRFEEHAETCDACSTLLTGVVYAVAACHSVHTFEELDVPEDLISGLVAVMPRRKRPMTFRIASRITSLAENLIPRATQNARWTFGTAASLSLAMFTFLLFGFSDDGTVSGVYRQARVRASELYSQGADIYTETDGVVARLERVGLGIGEFWDTLGGEAKPDGQDGSQNQDPNSNKQMPSTEKN